jgi:hypothetical protein
MVDEPELQSEAARAEMGILQGPPALSILFLEYLEHGDMWEWLKRRWVLKADEPGNEKVYDPLPNKVLWKIFDCCMFQQLSKLSHFSLFRHS